MSKITRRLATAAATLAITGGVVFATSGAASAATVESVSHATVSASHQTVRHNSNTQRWDGTRWWYRYNGHGDWYSYSHGVRYRFDGHKFYRWTGGKWKAVSTSYARQHDLNKRDFSRDWHHGRDDHGHDNGHNSGHGNGHDGKDDHHDNGHSGHGH
ncbi:hypothetical protein GCM10023194_34450 [Planotetraspora phitsanulokensis]|uniref:BcpO-related WXXGXW repeat protein n=1 Tax=Planotetraspora phitsanulokensis TaxID=575192 RepID=A0A8J3XDE0_9ACTN|nr:hypothetical protein [Planotetraspora phitsanulokensis]GII36426.1 hypothetical protein Pph01_14290 [Planotetraspora phitsanulokensis]